MKSWPMAVCVLVLMAAATLQFARVRDVKDGDQSTARRPIQLGQRIPAELPGWTGRDEPLGSTENIRDAVERTLNFDDYVYRVFRRGDITLGVYVAYWAPGRMPLQKVASHTPDRCWTENGWTCLDMKFAEKIGSAEALLLPAQWRVFEPPAQPGAREHVLFWHLVGGRLYDYGDRFNARPDIAKWWRDTVTYAFAGSDEQYFVRITSNRPFEDLSSDPAWPRVVEALSALGLAK